MPAEKKLIREGFEFFVIISFNEDVILSLKHFFFKLWNSF